MNPSDYVFLGMPGYGNLTGPAAKGFWRATRLPDERVIYRYNEGSLLASNFNRLWCDALNLARMGRSISYFAMQHADIEPQDWWLDELISELESTGLDVLGVVAPIKDPHGLTSLALDRPDGDTWRPLCRLTMDEVHALPPTFTGADLGHPLLLNTGLWVCRFGDWARKVHFTINDRIVQHPDGRYEAQVEPEDWYFSRLCHELGLRIGATRKVRLEHRGPTAFANDRVWGEAFDSAYVDKSQIISVGHDGFIFPHDVDGWLSYDEGHALYDLARGKRVLEIGSYCGRSTICLAQSARRVYAVDWFDGRGTPEPRDTLTAFCENIERYGVGERIHFQEPDASLPHSFDLVFIDGAHDYESVKSDISKARSVLSPDGLIAFHDFRIEPGQCDGRWDPGVTRAVSELLAEGGTLLSTHDTLAVVKPSAAIPTEV